MLQPPTGTQHPDHRTPMLRTHRTPWVTVAGTGPRDLHRGDPTWVADQLPQAASWLSHTVGTRYGISGMARRFDMDWAEAVLDAGLKLCLAIPFEQQPDRWSKADKARWAQIRTHAYREKVVGRVPDDLPPNRRGAVVNSLLFKRNRFMLDHCDAVLTVWEPGRLDGGTANTLLDAARRGLPGVHLDPIAQVVNFHLPTVEQLEPWALENTDCRHVALVGTRAAVTSGHTELAAAGFECWRTRRARPRETYDDGCGNCIEELALSCANRLGIPVP